MLVELAQFSISSDRVVPFIELASSCRRSGILLRFDGTSVPANSAATQRALNLAVPLYTVVTFVATPRPRASSNPTFAMEHKLSSHLS